MVLAGLTVFNAVIGLRQEAKAEDSVKALVQMMETIARMRRWARRWRSRARTRSLGTTCHEAGGCPRSGPGDRGACGKRGMMEGFGGHSEVGWLRKVMVHLPELSLQRLTPSNHDELLFDDVLWLERALYEHDYGGVSINPMYWPRSRSSAAPGWRAATCSRSGTAPC